MSYRGSNYTYGEKSTIEIAALPMTQGEQVGETVWNTDYHRPEHWTGLCWTNDNCVLMRETFNWADSPAGDLLHGELVAVADGGMFTRRVSAGSSSHILLAVGIVNHYVPGTDSIQAASVMTSGLAMCIPASNVTKGDYAEASNTESKFQGAATVGVGTFGVIMEDGLAGELTWVYLTGMERQ